MGQNSHKPVKGTPMPKSAHSSMEKEKGKNEISQPGEKKYGSNTMSPGTKEGRVNTYGS
jgi:hypothetical protein